MDSVGIDVLTFYKYFICRGFASLPNTGEHIFVQKEICESAFQMLV